MMQETEKEAILPEGYRWNDLVSKEGIEQLTFYRALLLKLGSESSNHRVQAIFANAQTALKKPKNLATLVASIDSLNHYPMKF
ncbi:MAG: hypothetical protein QNJ32_24455 [Xenococcaceae cyanobacterium MO_167.B27]|nr:hypothetical protein [Xenococcaceae cyanobacterium MO_167.B27]